VYQQNREEVRRNGGGRRGGGRRARDFARLLEKYPLRALAAGVGVAAAAYGACAGVAYYRYGRHPRVTRPRDEVLDRFMPSYDIVERHHIWVKAPAAITLATAGEQDLMKAPLIRLIFRMRAMVLGASPDDRARPRGLLAGMRSLGWGVLADVPDREIVMGAITKPWEPNVTFHALAADQFAAFSEAGFVKIAWTLRVHPVGASTWFCTETRALATDPTARQRFRRYWAFAWPGIAAIRWLLLRPLRRDAERRARIARRTNTSSEVQDPADDAARQE
jgi:hypothetical protein